MKDVTLEQSDGATGGNRINRERRILLIAFSVVILSMICFVLAFQFDAKLSSEAKTWLDTYDEENATESEAYFYLLGIVAPEEEDVLSVGRARFKAYHAATALSDSLTKVSCQDPLVKRLPAPENYDPLYLDKSKCWLDRFLKMPQRWDDELMERRTAHDRYLTFLKFREFRTMNDPRVEAIQGSYSCLRWGQTLRAIEILLMARDGYAREGIALLAEDIHKLRYQMVVADTYLHKVHMNVMIYKNLELIAHISIKYKPESNVFIPPFTAAERDMARATRSQFKFSHYIFQEFLDHPEWMDQSAGVPMWFMRSTFKPNMCSNIYLTHLKRLVYLSTLEPSAFAQADFSTKFDWSVFNLSGQIIINKATSIGEHDFIAGIHDTNCSIAIVNHLLKGTQTTLTNPYYPGQQVEMEEDGYCMTGPLEDPRDLRWIHFHATF